jgi:hypothetical protein
MELIEFMNAADALIERLAPRIDPQQAKLMRRTAYAGEWGETIDELIATLLARRTPVTPDERDELLRLLAYMKEPADRIDGLVVSGES